MRGEEQRDTLPLATLLDTKDSTWHHPLPLSPPPHGPRCAHGSDPYYGCSFEVPWRLTTLSEPKTR